MNHSRLTDYSEGVAQCLNQYKDWRYFLTIAYHKPIGLEKAWGLTRKYISRIVSKNKQILFIKLEGGDYTGNSPKHYHFHCLIGDSGIRFPGRDSIEMKLNQIKISEALEAGYNVDSSEVSFDIQDVDGKPDLLRYATKIQGSSTIPDNKYFLGEGGFRYWTSPGLRHKWSDDKDKTSFNDLSPVCNDH
jgi:hypothetical protein